MAESRMEQEFDLDPGTYVFKVAPGPSPGFLRRADGTEFEIGKEGGARTFRLSAPEKVIIYYQANGRPPANVSLEKVA